MHHLFQTKKLLRDLHQSDFDSSAARGWGDEWSDTVPGTRVHPSPALPGGGDILHALPQTSSSLVSPGWCLVEGGKPVVTEKWKNSCLSFFPWTAAGWQLWLSLLGLLSKMCRLGRCSTNLLLNPLQAGEHCFHVHGRKNTGPKWQVIS